MLNKQQIETAMGIERRIYSLLLDVMETTDDLSDSLNRGDQVAVRMFLNMRQDSINQLLKCKEDLYQQCRSMEPEAMEQLRQTLMGNPPCQEAEISRLAQQAEKNQTLLRRVIQADRAVNQRVSGKQSFYAQP